MLFATFNLDRAAFSIRVSRQREDSIQQPIGSGAPQKIIAPAQIEIARNVRAARTMCALRRLREGDFPGFIEFSHSIGGKQQT